MAKVFIAAHRPIPTGPERNAKYRGGERSVGIIATYLAGFHEVYAAHIRGPETLAPIADSDVVLTWGLPAETVGRMCRNHGVPYILMVRWFRNVAPLPPGNLMTRPVVNMWTEKYGPLFRRADAIVTNNEYSRGIIERWYPDAAPIHVSYVPVPGGLTGQRGNPDGAVTLVTDNKELGERELIESLAGKLPHRKFLVINAHHRYDHSNIETVPWQRYMDTLWARVGIVIYPVYHNDVCGTSRIGMEAMRRGIPALANDRCGIGEQGMRLIDADATPMRWAAEIEAIYESYDECVDVAEATYLKHEPEKELEVYKRLIDDLT